MVIVSGCRSGLLSLCQSSAARSRSGSLPAALMGWRVHQIMMILNRVYGFGFRVQDVGLAGWRLHRRCHGARATWWACALTHACVCRCRGCLTDAERTEMHNVDNPTRAADGVANRKLKRASQNDVRIPAAGGGGSCGGGERRQDQGGRLHMVRVSRRCRVCFLRYACINACAPTLWLSLGSGGM